MACLIGMPFSDICVQKVVSCMKDEAAIRNVAIMAHVDAGKTTITEHMLFESGKIRSLGSVDKGTAYSDYMDVERERGISVRSASISFAWKGVNINLIDTPGHIDFSAEVERSLMAVDCAVLVLSAVEGLQAHSENIWRALRARNIPTIIFINKADRVGADTRKVVKDIKNNLSQYAVPIQRLEGEGTADPSVAGIIEDVSSSQAGNDVIECLAEKDDGLLEAYLSGKDITLKELETKLSLISCKGEVYPVLFGSALKGIGIRELMDSIVKYLPGPSGKENLPLSGIVFRIGRDENMGRTAHVRLFNGCIKPRDMVLNITRGVEDKVTQVRRIDAFRYGDTDRIFAGDVGALYGLSSVQIGDILGSKTGVPQDYHLSYPFLTVQAFPSNQTDYPKLVEALMELSDEDPMLDVKWLKEKREVHLKIMGLIQEEVLSNMLRNRFGIEAYFSRASVIYKETPSKSGEGFISYTMPKPCWAVLRFLIEPGERGSGVKFSSTVRTEYILERYQKQVEKTIPKALEQGLYGWEVTDARITLIDGEYHVEHTRPPDFAVATPMGIMDGLASTGTTLLEPVLKFKISAPEEAGGRILNDLVQMRSTFDSPEILGSRFNVEGIVPGASSLDYHIKLAALTGGKGTISMVFDGYRECPIEYGSTCPRRGVDPLDVPKYILYARNAIIGE